MLAPFGLRESVAAPLTAAHVKVTERGFLASSPTCATSWPPRRPTDWRWPPSRRSKFARGRHAKGVYSGGLHRRLPPLPPRGSEAPETSQWPCGVSHSKRAAALRNWFGSRTAHKSRAPSNVSGVSGCDRRGSRGEGTVTATMAAGAGASRRMRTAWRISNSHGEDACSGVLTGWPSMGTAVTRRVQPLTGGSDTATAGEPPAPIAAGEQSGCTASAPSSHRGTPAWPRRPRPPVR